jgi:hypothetical protein
MTEIANEASSIRIPAEQSRAATTMDATAHTARTESLDAKTTSRAVPAIPAARPAEILRAVTRVVVPAPLPAVKVLLPVQAITKAALAFPPR